MSPQDHAYKVITPEQLASMSELADRVNERLNGPNGPLISSTVCRLIAAADSPYEMSRIMSGFVREVQERQRKEGS